jgi:hypothetical protein
LFKISTKGSSLKNPKTKHNGPVNARADTPVSVPQVAKPTVSQAAQPAYSVVQIWQSTVLGNVVLMARGTWFA